MENELLKSKRVLTHYSVSDTQLALKHIGVLLFVLSTLMICVNIAIVEYALAELRTATSAITPHPDLNMKTLETQLQSINNFIQEHKKTSDKNILDVERFRNALSIEEKE